MRGDDVAEAIIARKPRLSAMTLQKLLYYVQAWHLAITDEPLITDEPFRAYRDGPVHEDVWRQRREWATRARSTRAHHLDEVSDTILEMVLAEYGGRSGDELSALTHTEQPWLESRGTLPPEASSRNALSSEGIACFYRQHRTLGGRTAEDLAAGGLTPHWPSDESADTSPPLTEILDRFTSFTPASGYAPSAWRATDVDGLDYTGIGRRKSPAES